MADKKALFTFALRALADDLPKPEAEYKFHPAEKWRFDYAYPDLKLAVEVDGGQWMAFGGRHNRDTDRDKLNWAATLGWRVLRFSTQMLENDPQTCIDVFRAALQFSPHKTDNT